MKHLNKLVLLVAGLVSLASCGGESDSGKRVLKFEFLKAGFGTEVYERLASKFEEEHPDVQVKLIPNKDILTETPGKLSSGKNLSDVYLIQNATNNIRAWSLKGLIYSLDDLYASEVEDGETLAQRIDDTALSYSQFNGHYYSVPDYYNINGFVYNDNLFQQNNLSVPKTTSELIKVCQTLKSSVDPIIYCGTSASGYLYYMTEGIMTSYEGISNLDNFYKFQDPELFSAANSGGKIYGLSNLDKIFYKSGYSYSRSMNTGYIDAQTKVIKGEAAMMLNGSWFETEMATIMSHYPDAKIKMFAVPQVSDDSGTVLHSSTYTTKDEKPVINSEFNQNYFIPEGASNKDDAVDFLKFLSRSDVCELYTQLTNCVRPFKYDKDPSSDTYKDMSDFGKSVLTIVNENYLYVATSKNAVAIKGEISLWPSGLDWNYKIYSDDVTYSPENCVTTDYQYVKSHWSGWFGE